MFKVYLVIAALIIGAAVHMIVALMALINFMWVTALLAAIVSCTCIWFVDQLETAIREGEL